MVIYSIIAGIALKYVSYGQTCPAGIASYKEMVLKYVSHGQTVTWAMAVTRGATLKIDVRGGRRDVGGWQELAAPVPDWKPFTSPFSSLCWCRNGGMGVYPVNSVPPALLYLG
jgi:hypothetical protein